MGKIKALLVPMALGALGAIVAFRLVPGATKAAKVTSTDPKKN